VTEYEELTTSAGSFVSWTEPGDSVEGRVVSFSIDGGRNFDGDPVPELVLDTADGTQTITCSQANLKRLATELAARFVPGTPCRIEFEGMKKTANGTGEYKSFKAFLPPAGRLVDVTDEQGF
jgi:hypothetical protein